jgi:hypothetical protein
MIALVTVSFQAIKAAIANPVKSLRRSSQDPDLEGFYDCAKLRIVRRKQE